jgi:replicative DNA helicase
MPSLRFNDFDTERYFLACCLKGPEHWKNIPEAWLHEDISKRTYKSYKSFLSPPYATYPTVELIIEKSSDVDVKLFTQEISQIKIDEKLINSKVYDLYEMYAARKVFDIVERVPNEMEKGKIEEVIRSKVFEFSQLVNPFEAGSRERGFIYESAAARWERYRMIEKNPQLLGGIPYHISDLDKYTSGGLRKSHVVSFFAETGGFKTKVMLNLAYNFSFLDEKEVMVITLEVPKDDYESLIDSRHSLLSFNEIRSGALGGNKEHYRQQLINIKQTNPRLYIVDIPGEATTADIIAELELYYTIRGNYPSVIILDYLNEIEPVSSWNNTSEKFKNAGVEIRRIARTYKVGFVTSMMENREGKKIKDKTKIGLEHVSESHYFANVCHLFIHLYQDAEGVDAATNQLHWHIKKNRYGPKHVSFTTFVNPDLNYVGDRHIIVPPN